MLMKDSTLFSIVIVTYQSENWIGACLDALERQVFQDFEVIIVDNASQDATLVQVASARTLTPRIVKNAENLGFAAGCNQGASIATSTWLIFLNPDTVVSVNWLLEIKSGIARYPNAAMFACAQFKLEAPDTLDGAGDVYSIFGIPWRGGEDHPKNDLPNDGECFGPCGAAAVFLRKTFSKHEGFDEALFCYCEDVDLAFRMRLANEQCIFLRNARVFHKGGGSAKEGDQTFATYHGFRNRTWVYLKNMPIGLLILLFPAHVLLTFVQAFSARKLNRGYSKLIVSAFFDAVRGAPTVWRDRSKIDHKTHIKNVTRIMCKSFTKLRRRSTHVLDIKN